MLVFKNIDISREGRLLQRDLSFAVKAGQKIALTGPSGSGKSSLLRVAMGFDRADAGAVFMDGLEVNRRTIAGLRNRFAFAPQNFHAPGNVSRAVASVFEFKANRAAAPDGFQIGAMMRDLALSPEEEFLQRSVADLSAGERSRVGLAIALLLHRPLVVMDEPTANLDDETRARVIDKLTRDDGRAMLIATHDRILVRACDEEVALNG